MNRPAIDPSLETLLDRLQSRSADRPWLWGAALDDVWATAAARSRQLGSTPTSGDRPAPRVLLAAADPAEFLGSFLAATAARSTLFLGDPHWGHREQTQAIAIARPDIIWTDWAAPHSPALFPSAPLAAGTIAIPTGGSTGTLKFALHRAASLAAAVAGFCQHFSRELPDGRVNALCTLPLHHVSGLMQFLRCALSGGCLALGTPRDRPALPNGPWCLSLVPTQLVRLLDEPGGAAWLRSFQVVLVGGAPPWPALLDRARTERIRLAPTYGMTETAAQVATLHPDDFLAGDSSAGPPLPHVRLNILDRDGHPLPPNHTGTIAIATAARCSGYAQLAPRDREPFRSPGDRPEFHTGDLGYLDDRGHLHPVGRRGDTIITGGENVHPAEVEAALRDTGLVADVCVLGLPDAEWGQAIAAICVLPHPDAPFDPQPLRAALRDRLSRYKQPKYWYAIAQLPRNRQGKVERSRLLAWVGQPPLPPPPPRGAAD